MEVERVEKNVPVLHPPMVGGPETKGTEWLLASAKDDGSKLSLWACGSVPKSACT